MPCASCFAVCCLSGTRQRHYLSCAKETAHGKHRAHGKDHICRVPYVGHTAKLWQRACGPFCLPCATRLARGKHVSCGNGLVAHFVCRVPPVWHTANMSPVSIGRVPLRGTRQSLQKKFDFAIPNFSILCIQYMLLRTKLWYFSL